MMLRTIGLCLVLCGMGSASPLQAAVIAADDFEAQGSGIGWASADDWDGAVAGGVATVDNAAVLRALASPIDTTTVDKLYLSFSFTKVAGTTWAGVSFFDGGSEELFIGHTSPFFSINVTGLGDFPSGVSVDASQHRLMMEVDFDGGTAGNDLVRLYVDHSDLTSPDATADIASTYLPEAFTHLRIATEGIIEIDNLCIGEGAPCSPGFTVDTALDIDDASPGDGTCDDGAGNCSLRAALQEANALAGSVTVAFDASLNGTPITLTAGQLDAVEADVTLSGNGSAETIIQASECNPVTLPGGCTPADHRVLEVAANGTLVLAGLGVRHGRCAGACATLGSDGGGILNGGVLVMSRVDLSGNHASAFGGALRNLGSITSITNSSFSGNLAGDEGGAIYNYYSSSPPWIGDIVGCQFSDNHAISTSVCTEGGAILAGEIGRIAFTTFSGNTAESTVCASGGAIYADGNLALITDSTFTDNAADGWGGAIYTDSTDSLGDITRCLFAGNTGVRGGALYEHDGSMGEISNSTFSGNSATAWGGAIGIGPGGTIGGLTHVTVVGNSAPLGAGLHADGSLSVTGSIIAGSTGGGGNCSGAVLVSDSRDDDDSCTVDDIVLGVDLGPVLSANGGSSPTHALLAGSVAIDDADSCPGSLDGVDQRGAARADGLCDLGAVELVDGFIFADGFLSGTAGAWSSGTDVATP